MSDEERIAHTRSIVAAATWDRPDLGVVLGRVVVDATPLQTWAGQVEAASGVAVGAPHVALAAVARGLVAAPGLNRIVRLGRPVQRNGVAVTWVDGGRHRRVDDADALTVAELAVAVDTSDDEAAWEQTGRTLRHVPTAMLRLVMRLLGLMGRVGAAVPGLGVEPGAMGAAVVERGAGFDSQFNPPVPHVAAGVHVVVGSVTDAVVVHAGAPAVRPTLELDVAIDARLCPNDELDVFVAVLRQTLGDPWSLGGADRPRTHHG